MGKKILIVEDEIVIRRLCERILTKLGHQLIFAESVQTALAAAQNMRPDLLISDLKLPDGHGSAVIQRLKENYPEMRVIIMTGSPTPDEKLALLASLGDFPCLRKPFDNFDLEKAVRNALEK